MRIITPGLVVILGLALAQLAAADGPRSNTKIVLVADQWAPFSMKPNSAQEGYIVEIAREIFQKEGIGIEYAVLPWARAVAETRLGLYNAVIGASHADAPGFVFPMEPLAVNYLGFFTRPNSKWKYEGPSSVASVSIAVIRGYDYRQWLSDYVVRNENNPARIQMMVGERPLESNIRKVLAGNVDVVVDSTTAVLYTLKTMGLTGSLRFAGSDKEAALIYVAFSPALSTSAGYAKILSSGITEMRRSGRLTQILAKYGLEDWSHDK